MPFLTNDPLPQCLQPSSLTPHLPPPGGGPPPPPPAGWGAPPPPRRAVALHAPPPRPLAEQPGRAGPPADQAPDGADARLPKLLDCSADAGRRRDHGDARQGTGAWCAHERHAVLSRRLLELSLAPSP